MSTVQEIVRDTAEAIWEVLSPECMPPIVTAQQWKSVADGFLQCWQFPHYCGALDGKHCTVQKPLRTGSLFWNYKKSFSIILIALVDSNYKYIMIDVGAAGSQGDSNTFRDSAFSQLFFADKILFPPAENFPDTNNKAPYVLVGDEAFPSDFHLLKLFPKKSKSVPKKIRAVYNYRLSRVRICVECSFGILTS